MLTARPPHQHHGPHPARRQLRPTQRAVPVAVQSERLAGEYAARSVGIPKPATASFWRYLAECRGEVAVRDLERDLRRERE